MKNYLREFSLEAPVLFNCWKHHKEFIQTQICTASKGGNMSLKKLTTNLFKIGDSLLDLYTGILKPLYISQQIKNELEKRNIHDQQSYEAWILNSKNNYQIIYLSDNSFWTLRLGKVKGKYIHIHPGRYSPYTIRIRALTLKTAITVIAYAKSHKVSSLDITLINQVRTKLLNVSPIKAISNKDGLGKIILMLEKSIKH